MPKELRAILFTADEVRSVIEHFMQKGAGGRKAHSVEKVELEIVKGALSARVQILGGADAKPPVFGPQDLMTAVLMYCGFLRIPLSSRALKQLEIASSGLMLTMSLNQDSSGPRVTGNAIAYSAPMPTAMTEVVSSVRE